MSGRVAKLARKQARLDLNELISILASASFFLRLRVAWAILWANKRYKVGLRGKKA